MIDQNVSLPNPRRLRRNCPSLLVTIVFTVAVISILSEQNLCHGMPTPDEESFSREYAKELTGWLAALGPPPLSTAGGHPCPHYNSVLPPSPPLPYFVPLDKRNSELINSLLTLPKQMNEAGK